MISPDLRRKRLLIEFGLMLENAPTFACIDKGLSRYLGVIPGCGLYDGGYFVVEILLPSAYPYCPPLVLWYTPIWHPNISKPRPNVIVSMGSGGMIFAPCFFMEHFKDYTPAHHVFGLIELIRTYLAEPDTSHPLNPDAARQLLEDPERFAREVEAHLKYADFDKSVALLERLLRYSLSKGAFKELWEGVFKDLRRQEKPSDEIEWIRSTMTLVNRLLHKKSIEKAKRLMIESKRRKIPAKRVGRSVARPTGSICQICLSEISEDDEVFKCPYCGSLMHVSCLENWMRIKGDICPICCRSLSHHT